MRPVFSCSGVAVHGEREHIKVDRSQSRQIKVQPAAILKTRGCNLLGIISFRNGSRSEDDMLRLIEG